MGYKIEVKAVLSLNFSLSLGILLLLSADRKDHVILYPGLIQVERTGILGILHVHVYILIQQVFPLLKFCH